MQLTGPQLKRLHPLLLRAFPSYRELKRLALFGLDLNLDTIVDSHDLNAAVFDLLDWSHARDRDGELVAAAVEANADRADLRAFAIEVEVLAAPKPTDPRTGTANIPTSSQPTYRTLIVDPLARASNYSTISAAIFAARPGDRIMVRPGIYTEGLVINKPLEIIGDGNRAEIVVQASKKPVVLFQTSGGRVQNLTLRQTGGRSFWGADVWYGVDIQQGRLELEDCDISSASWVCVVVIHNGADLRLRHNHIHNGESAGVLIYENGQGLLEDNDITANALAGVEISSGGNATLRGNRIYNGKSAGVIIHENGQGVLEDNNITANVLAGVEISSGGNATLRGNHIYNGKSAGVFIYENGQGLLEDNDITANAEAGVVIKTGGNPTLRRNRIHKNVYQGIWIYEGGAGTFENNDLRDNAGGAWAITPECLPNVKRSGNIE